MALRLCKLKSATPNWKGEFRSRLNPLALAAIRSKIRLGLDQLQRVEGIPEDQLNSHLAKLQAKLE
jgi:hypothetical protein